MDLQPTVSAKIGCSFISADPDWRRKLFRGGLILLIPFVGWPIILGYRKEAITRLLNNADPLLPEWESNTLLFLSEGLKCIGVIASYLSPVTIYVWLRISNSAIPEDFPWALILGFFFVFPIFSPLALPLITVYFTFISESLWSPLEACSILACYSVLVFLIPLGFLRVSLSKSYLSAFNLRACLQILKDNPLNYLAAWVYSSVISLAGHFCIPFSPWGVVWAYLGIVYYFNEILYLDDKRKTEVDTSWFERLREIAVN